MKIEVGSELRIRNPAMAVVRYCASELTLSNPNFYKLEQMGKWTGNEPREIHLYRSYDGKDLWIPFGCLQDIWGLHNIFDDYSFDLAPKSPVPYTSRITLRDYQQQAISALDKHRNGIIVSPCGSGKTTMGIEIIARLGQRALWITHTTDLLYQSKERAREYLGLMGNEIGEITAGKVQLGSHITFATVQTLSKWGGLEKHKYTWPVVIVDESHRSCVTGRGLGMFAKCLSSLAARHKFGLTATAHRSDGLIRGMYALLGDCICEIDKEELAGSVVPVRIEFRATNYDYSTDCLDADGTIIFGKLQEDIALDTERNQLIADDLVSNKEHYSLILSDRLFHLNMLKDALPATAKAALIDGKTPKHKREQAIEDMRAGRINYLFATYALAKEGLDIPRLDRLYMALPKKDYAVVIQSVGRIARAFENKEEAIVYDYVDPVGMCIKMHRERQMHYRRQGYKMNLLILGRNEKDGYERKAYEWGQKAF